jgi:hypothetical protein
MDANVEGFYYFPDKFELSGFFFDPQSMIRNPRSFSAFLCDLGGFAVNLSLKKKQPTLNTPPPLGRLG